jgi:hypothetical protein
MTTDYELREELREIADTPVKLPRGSITKTVSYPMPHKVEDKLVLFIRQRERAARKSELQKILDLAPGVEDLTTYAELIEEHVVKRLKELEKEG